ncbi:MAG TPA: response regulator [Gemmataceae bacterium]|nr:response regulator [Gemmataceae bacterium]
MSVLVVDDNSDAALMLELLLTQAGYRVVTAGDEASAVAAAEAQPPDAVFLDIILPGGTGYEIGKRLCSMLDRRPLLVAVTGVPDLQDDSRRAGFDHHLVKPVDPAVVLRLLADHAARLP